MAIFDILLFSQGLLTGLKKVLDLQLECLCQRFSIGDPLEKAGAVQQFCYSTHRAHPSAQVNPIRVRWVTQVGSPPSITPPGHIGRLNLPLLLKPLTSREQGADIITSLPPTSKKASPCRTIIMSELTGQAEILGTQRDSINSVFGPREILC